MISNEFNFTAAFGRQSNVSILQTEIRDMESHVGNLEEVEIEVGCPRWSASKRDSCLKVGTVLSVSGSSYKRKS